MQFIAILPPVTLVLHCLSFLEIRIRFLFGGQHGEFRFFPPPGFTACSDALLPKVKLKVEPCQKYMLNHEEGKHDLIGPLIPTIPVVFIPAPVDISKVTAKLCPKTVCVCVCLLIYM